MHFVSNKIYTGSKVPTLSEVFKAARTQAALENVKTASSSSEVVTKESRGNVDNLTAPRFGPGGKPVKEEKEACNCGKMSCEYCGKVKEGKDKKAAVAAPAKVAEKEEEEGETSGQPEAEAKLVNDPHKDPKLKEGGVGGDKVDKSEGESSGQLDVEPLHQKGESTGEKPDGLNTEKKEEKKEAKTVANTLKKIARFKKMSELNPKQKEYLRSVYRVFWPQEFVDALLASK